MRIGINDGKKQADGSDTLGVEAHEVAGPGGANMTGGDVTPHQNAGEVADAATHERSEDQKMEERQAAGEVGKQREDLHPAAKDSVGGNDSDGAGDGTMRNNSGGHDSADDSNADAKKNSDAAPASELDEVKTQLLQTAADFENFRRQAARREQETRERAVRGVLEDLLPVLDNFERAVGAADSTADVKSLKMGVEYILQQFQEAIKSSGAEPIEAVGQPFDPSQHDAIEEVESDAQPGTVVDDVQRGYIYKGKVMRPSRVRVAK